MTDVVDKCVHEYCNELFRLSCGVVSGAMKTVMNCQACKPHGMHPSRVCTAAWWGTVYNIKLTPSALASTCPV